MSKPATPTGTYQRIPLTDLVPYPGNARRGNVELIAASLERYGQYRPLTIQRSTMRVIAGNHTMQAASQLGWTAIDCQLIDCDDDTATRINVLDNRANDVAEYDLEALALQLQSLDVLEGTGWADDDLAGLLAQIDAATPKPAKTDPDEAPPVPTAVPVTRPGDVWQLGPHRLVCGDSTEAGPWGSYSAANVPTLSGPTRRTASPTSGKQPTRSPSKMTLWTRPNSKRFSGRRLAAPTPDANLAPAGT